MDRKYFIEGIKAEVRDSAVSDTMENLIDPPGRSPSEKDIKLSQFFKKLPEESKLHIKEIISNSVDSAVFGFLCILDHVRFLEGAGEKTTFELYAVKNGERVLLNDSSKEDLHDVYNEIVQED